VDTREKIVPLEQLHLLDPDTAWVAVVGLFDPLTLVQARRLAELRKNGHKLLAIVLEAEDVLLTSLARAVLVAALRSVDAVTISEHESWRSMMPHHRFEIVEDMKAERTRTAEFINFILDRQRNGPAGARP
jgi:hypothetical protein